jgi:hypothetical protein
MGEASERRTGARKHAGPPHRITAMRPRQSKAKSTRSEQEHQRSATQTFGRVLERWLEPASPMHDVPSPLPASIVSC